MRRTKFPLQMETRKERSSPSATFAPQCLSPVIVFSCWQTYVRRKFYQCNGRGSRGIPDEQKRCQTRTISRPKDIVKSFPTISSRVLCFAAHPSYRHTRKSLTANGTSSAMLRRCKGRLTYSANDRRLVIYTIGMGLVERCMHCSSDLAPAVESNTEAHTVLTPGAQSNPLRKIWQSYQPREVNKDRCALGTRAGHRRSCAHIKGSCWEGVSRNRCRPVVIFSYRIVSSHHRRITHKQTGMHTYSPSTDAGMMCVLSTSKTRFNRESLLFTGATNCCTL